jgi:hypothetical protein
MTSVLLCGVSPWNSVPSVVKLLKTLTTENTELHRGRHRDSHQNYAENFMLQDETAN